MSKKWLVALSLLFLTLALFEAETFARRTVEVLSLNASPIAQDNSDKAIEEKVVVALKKLFTPQKRAENFKFSVTCVNGVVTLKGFVTSDKMRLQVIKAAQKALAGSTASLNSDHKKEPRRAKAPGAATDNNLNIIKSGACPEGKEECFNGECREPGTCPVNNFNKTE